MTDPLLDKIARLRRGASDIEEAGDQRRRGESRRRLVREIAGLSVFWSQVSRSALWLWSYVVGPALSWLMIPVRAAFRIYVRLWNRWTKVDDGGDMVFSRRRGAVMVAVTAAFLYVVPQILDTAFDATLYAVTANRDETVYLISSQEIYPDYNIHTVKGCDDLPCTDQNSFYFRVRPTWFNHLWSLWRHGWIFFPDYVAAATPAGATKCVITSYGVRMKLFMRSLDIYPDLLEVSCRTSP